jgi:adenine phosphoribosyltransferase
MSTHDRQHGERPSVLSVSDELTARARQAYLRRFSWIHGHADTWSSLRDAATLALMVDALGALVERTGATLVLGIEARGFLLGPAVARTTSLGFVAVRKGDGLFAGATASTLSTPDYRGIRQQLRIRSGDLRTGDVVVLVDDWIETGSQAGAARSLVEQTGARWAGCVVIVDQAEDDVHARVGPVHAIVPGDLLP